MQNVTGGAQEGGFSSLLILGGLLVFGLAMSKFMAQQSFSSRSQKVLHELIADKNDERTVIQVVADDQLCAQSSLLSGLSAWDIKGVKTPKVLKDDDAFATYPTIGAPQTRWPSDPYKGEIKEETPTGQVLSGIGTISGIIIQQPSDREVRKTVVNGQTYYRIPINIHNKIRLQGQTFPSRFGLEAYIELDPADPTRAVACYQSVSSRSLCLDAGGVFDPTLPTQKCKIP